MTFTGAISPRILDDYQPTRKIGTVTYHDDLEQGTDEWLEVRRGVLTASEMKLIITPSLNIASNEKERAHLYELLAQRVSGFVEPTFISDDMLRGREDEIEARLLYHEHYAEVQDCGFITNDRWGFTLGYSPDGLVGEDGLWEAKSRRQKFQVQTLLDYAAGNGIPADFIIQCQTGLLVSERKWLDFSSYCGGLPMLTARVYPDPDIQDAIVEAAEAFHERIKVNADALDDFLKSDARLIPTERREYEDILA